MGQLDADTTALFEGPTLPQHLVESGRAAVQVIAPVVLRERERFSVEREGGAGDAVRVPADQRPHEERIGDIVFESVVAEDDVIERAARVGGPKGDEDAPIVGHLRANALGIRELVKRGRAPVPEGTEGSNLDHVVTFEGSQSFVRCRP